MSQIELHERVDRLLHDAGHAASGARMARLMIGRIASAPQDAKRLNAQAAALIAEATLLDPERTAPAWEEANV